MLANCTYYLTTLSNPSLALRFFDGGYALSGAVAGLILAAGLTEKWRKLPRGVLLDAVGLGMLPGIAVERLGEAGTGMGLGRAIYTPWLAKLPFFAATDETGEIVHAVYRYEALAAALIFAGVMIYLIFRGKEALRGGDVLLMVLTLLGCVQVLLESLRNDGHMVVHFVRINQVLAMALPVIALAIWSRRGKKPLVSWLVVVAAIALATRQEFRIDSSENLWLDYGIMALCLALVAVTTLRRRSGRGFFSENPPPASFAPLAGVQHSSSPRRSMGCMAPSASPSGQKPRRAKNGAVSQGQIRRSRRAAWVSALNSIRRSVRSPRDA